MLGVRGCALGARFFFLDTDMYVFPNAKFLYWRYCPTQSPNVTDFALQWNIGFRVLHLGKLSFALRNVFSSCIFLVLISSYSLIKAVVNVPENMAVLAKCEILREIAVLKFLKRCSICRYISSVLASI